MLLEVRELSKSYPQAGLPQPVAALEKISFSLAENELICILGPSGCGKSSLLNLIAGFIQPDHGMIRFDGGPINGPGPERGVVFQEPTLFPWLNIRHNIELGLKAAGAGNSEQQRKVSESLELVGLHCSQNAYPHQLSGGMKQRVALARVLALEPRLLLMDEPFSALDAETREHLQDKLLKVCAARRQSVLFVTHSIEEAAYLADRVIVMGTPPASLHTELRIHREKNRERSGKNLSLNVLRLRTVLKELSRCVPETENREAI